MMTFNTLREVVQFRIIESEDNYWVEDYLKAAIEMYAKDISATIMFFRNDCDDKRRAEIFSECTPITTPVNQKIVSIKIVEKHRIFIKTMP